METIGDFRKAREALQGVILETSLIYSEHMSKISGNKVYLKPENMQVTGSFKPRGAINAVLSLPPEQQRRGIVTASGGNHGFAVAYAGHATGAPATISCRARSPVTKSAISRAGAPAR